MASPTVKLNSGYDIPLIGLGTWKSGPNEVATAVEHALKAGYRHIDCAWAYGNEEEVGRGIKASGVPREEIFVTSKLWGTYHTRVEEACDISLNKLGLDYLDLYLVHWPVALNPNGNNSFIPTLPDGTRDVDFSRKLTDTWKAMEELVHKGKVRSIGASNFSAKMLDTILPTAAIPPATDQLELHIWNPDLRLLAYLKEKGITPQAYSPLGSTDAPLMKDETVGEIAAKHGVNPENVLIGWHVAKGTVVLPKSVTPSRIESNLTATLEAYPKLTPEDITRLDGIAAAGKQQRLVMPPWVIDLGLDNWTNKG